MSVAKDQVVEIEIVDLGDGGEGIGRFEGMTLFVDGAIIGDRVKVKIHTVKKNYAIGKVVGLIQPSSFRVEPECPHFRKCGGCQIMQMDYEQGQLSYKAKVVKDALERIGGFKDLSIEPIIGMKNPLRYRNKGQYPVQMDRAGQLALGFYEKASHTVVNVSDCLLQSESHALINQLIRDFIIEHNVSLYDEHTHKGILRHVMIRNSQSGGLMVVLVINAKSIRRESLLVEKLKSAVEKLESIVINVNESKGNRVLGFENRVIYGTPSISDHIDDLKFEISPLSFFQVNPVQTEILYQKALEYAELTGKENVVDIYCGIGTISLFLAQKAKKVVGVELIDAAIADAKANALRNGFDNTEFHVGKAEEVIPSLYEQGLSADVVVVDPPRKGCEREVLETILKMAPQRIVYVSCKPATMARDLKILCESGAYEVVKVQPVDQFPHTSHVEAIILMTRSGSGDKK